MSKFCTECGSPINENAKFCRQCGAPVKSAAKPAVPPQHVRPAAPVRPTVPPNAEKKPERPAPASFSADAPAKKPINKVTIAIIAAATVVILALILIFTLTGGEDAAVNDTPAADNSPTTENTPDSSESETPSPESGSPSADGQSPSPAPGDTDPETPEPAVPEDPADDTSKIASADEFIDWLQGYWVHLDGARIMQDRACMFETVFYEGTDSYYVFHPGGYDAPGKVKNIKQISDNVFEYTEYYEAYMGPDGEQPEAMYTITVYIENGPTRTISFEASRGMKWTYMGSTIEEANENVYLYLTSSQLPQPPQESASPYDNLTPCATWYQMSDRSKLFAAAEPLVSAISDSTDDPKSHVGFLNSLLEEVDANGLREEPYPAVMMINDTFAENYGLEPYVVARESYITIILNNTDTGDQLLWDFSWDQEVIASPGFSIREYLAEIGVL